MMLKEFSWIARDTDGEMYLYDREPGELDKDGLFSGGGRTFLGRQPATYGIQPGHKAPITITVGQPIDCRPKPPLVFNWQIIGDIEVCVCEGYTALIRPVLGNLISTVYRDGKCVEFSPITRNREFCEKAIREQLGRS